MKKDKIDHSGETHGRLTLIRKNGDKQEYFCSCSCGKYTEENSKLIPYARIRSGNTKSCGCLMIDKAIEKITKYNNANQKRNIYELSGEYGVGYTTKGEPFYFDLEDYDKIKNYCWWINDGYVCTKINKKKVIFHNILFPNAEEVDHKNHKTIDNQKDNLRVVTHGINMMNKKEYINNTSGVTGVSWDKSKNKWTANISVRNQRYQKGFNNFEDAVQQRKLWEDMFFGEYSYDNSMREVM